MNCGVASMDTIVWSDHRGRMSILLETVTVATAIASGLVGGVFFAFSNFVMAALGARPDREGLAAMQAINVTVLNPLFMLLLFAPVVACAGLAIAALGDLGLGVADASIVLEEINRSGGSAAACHAQMYTMGALLRHGGEAQNREYLPRIASGELRLQA